MDSLKIIEQAAESGKLDAARKIGGSNIGESHALLENSDWVGIILKEYKATVDTHYMTIKEVKARSKKGGLTYFAQPFAPRNGMVLLEDIDDEKPKGVTSIADETLTTSALSNTGKRRNARTRRSIDEETTGPEVLNNIDREDPTQASDDFLEPI